jgi:hypothetical protein
MMKRKLKRLACGCRNHIGACGRRIRIQLLGPMLKEWSMCWLISTLKAK